MIERKFVAQKMKEFQIQEYISDNLKNVGHSHTKVQRTPLGEKIVIHASRPGLIVGRKGQNIKELTKQLKKRFELDNPQIEITEVEDINKDARIIAERIASSLEKFGSGKFKAVGHRTMADVMNSGALGIEILITGKIPSSRSKRWRFYQGYLKKCGDIAVEGVKQAYASAHLKSGIVGIQVRIMPPDIKLPDNVQLIEEKETVVEESDEKKEGKAEDKEKKAKKKQKTKSESSGNKEKESNKEEDKKKDTEDKEPAEIEGDKKSEAEDKVTEPAEEGDQTGEAEEKNKEEDKPEEQ
ncbi:30S ribosomal protein S3 [Candidatus Woesearchaeota archaeon]|nr:30S ribosomal protein S3 [Candidatus Woesearchaeota archaeon]